MNKNIIITFLLFILTIISWYFCIIVNPSGYEIIMLVVSIAFTIMFICYCSVMIVKKINKNISAYLVFAIMDILIGIYIAIYAVYDLKTDTGWFAGLVGAILLVFVVPVTVILLVADFIIWKLKK